MQGLVVRATQQGQPSPQGSRHPSKARRGVRHPTRILGTATAQAHIHTHAPPCVDQLGAQQQRTFAVHSAWQETCSNTTRRDAAHVTTPRIRASQVALIRRCLGHGRSLSRPRALGAAVTPQGKTPVVSPPTGAVALPEGTMAFLPVHQHGSSAVVSRQHPDSTSSRQHKGGGGVKENNIIKTTTWAHDTLGQASP
mgnify:CR=1 FL=1